MLYFFHHYELPVILQQAQIRSYLICQKQHQFHSLLLGIFLTASKQEQMELVGMVEVEEQVKVVRVLREKEGGLRVLDKGMPLLWEGVRERRVFS